MNRFLTLLLACALAGCTADASRVAPRNVIFFVADGCGPATFTFARDYLRGTGQRKALHSDAHRSGAVVTFASDSDITDSASSATAYACGVKTYNGAIGMNDDRQAVTSVLELAEDAGWRTGLVSTARITHATPAAFSSHVESRSMEAEIAAQQATQEIDLILGGGAQWYLPLQEGGSREDGRNLIQELESNGYAVVADRGGLWAASSLPLVGLFTHSHMAYEIDRDPSAEPSLAEMTGRALELLSAEGDPFFIVIEAGRIDHAGHGNDAAAHLRDMLAYDEAFKVALDFASSNSETLVVATSDHETGGLTLGAAHEGLNSYGYDAAALDGVHASIERTRSDLVDRIQAGVQSEALTSWLMSELELRFQSGDVFTNDAPAIRVAVEQFMAEGNDDRLDFVWDRVEDEQARRARIGWSTGGHTAVDVPLFAYGPGAGHFSGVLDNTQVGLRLAAAMDLEFPEVAQ